MQWTWVTFPAMVLAFSGGTFALAHWLKGSELRVNQVDLVDLDAESGLVRGTSWSTLYSPRIDTFDLALRADPSEIRAEPAAAGAAVVDGGAGQRAVGTGAGGRFGDVHPALRFLPPARRHRAFADRDVVDPIAAGPLVGRGPFAPGGPVDRPWRSLAGWHAAIARRLAADRRGVDLRPLGLPAAGERRAKRSTSTSSWNRKPWKRTSGTSRSSTRKVAGRLTIGPSTDLARILETMMFHSLTGGELYTNLANRCARLCRPVGPGAAGPGGAGGAGSAAGRHAVAQRAGEADRMAGSQSATSRSESASGTICSMPRGSI